MTQTKFSTLPKENWDSETDIEPDNISPANDWNQITSEVIDVIEKSGEEADTSLQVAQAIMKNALCADFFTDTSTVANTIVLTDNGTFSKPTEYTDGMKVSFLANYSNTGSTTINVNSLGVKNIYLDANSSPLTGNEVIIDKLTELRYNATIDAFILNVRELSRATTSSYGLSIFNKNFIYGLVPTSNLTTPDEDLDISTGKALCKDGSTIISLDTAETALSMPTLLGSALANSTTYHLFRYKKNDDTDQWHLSTSLTPTIADIKSANAYRGIFSFKTASDGDIIPFFSQESNSGDLEVYYNNTGIFDYSALALPPSYTNIALSIPAGKCKPKLFIFLFSGAEAGGNLRANLYLKNDNTVGYPAISVFRNQAGTFGGSSSVENFYSKSNGTIDILGNNSVGVSTVIELNITTVGYELIRTNG